MITRAHRQAKPVKQVQRSKLNENGFGRTLDPVRDMAEKEGSWR